MHDPDAAMKTGAAVRAALGASERTAVVVSDPIDPDCLGTALALVWWLTAQGRQASAVSFVRIPGTLQTFPDVDTVTVADPLQFDFDAYDLVVLVDRESGGREEIERRGVRFHAFAGISELLKLARSSHSSRLGSEHHHEGVSV